MTPGTFCISYFYMNLSNKQISIYVAKLKQKAISKLTTFTQNLYKYYIFHILCYCKNKIAQTICWHFLNSPNNALFQQIVQVVPSI